MKATRKIKSQHSLVTQTEPKGFYFTYTPMKSRQTMLRGRYMKRHGLAK